METIRLPFLGPGWFAEAIRAGAQKDAAGWYMPPGAVLSASLRAHIEQAGAKKASPPKRREADTETAETAVRCSEPAPWPVEAVTAFCAEGEANMAAARRAGVMPGEEWALRIFERQAAGDTRISGYPVELARLALGLE